MNLTAELVTNSGGFDELVVQKREEQSSPGAAIAVKTIGVALILAGCAWFGTLVIFYLKQGAVLQNTALPELYSQFGQATSAPIGLMSVGVLVFSFGYLAKQLRLQHESKVERDMPIVVATPRLLWKPDSVQSGELQLSHLRLFVGIRNLGDSSAVKMRVHVGALTYVQPEDHKIQLDVVGERSRWVECLPPRASGPADDEASIKEDCTPCIDLDLLGPCKELIRAIFRDGANTPRIEMTFSVTFETITRGLFCSCARVTWSPAACRTIGGPLQQTLISKWHQALGDKKHVNFADLLRGGNHPLSPILQEIPCIPAMRNQCCGTCPGRPVACSSATALPSYRR